MGRRGRDERKSRYSWTSWLKFSEGGGGGGRAGLGLDLGLDLGGGGGWRGDLGLEVEALGMVEWEAARGWEGGEEGRRLSSREFKIRSAWLLFFRREG